MSVLDEIKDDYLKVSSGLSGTIHLSSMLDGYHTLCGRFWWAENQLGDTYCKTCQHILAVRVSRIEAAQQSVQRTR